jgi:hypothetical protein
LFQDQTGRYHFSWKNANFSKIGSKIPKKYTNFKQIFETNYKLVKAETFSRQTEAVSIEIFERFFL